MFEQRQRLSNLIGCQDIEQVIMVCIHEFYSHREQVRKQIGLSCKSLIDDAMKKFYSVQACNHADGIGSTISVDIARSDIG